jgi:hypothetical protein
VLDIILSGVATGLALVAIFMVFQLQNTLLKKNPEVKIPKSKPAIVPEGIQELIECLNAQQSLPFPEQWLMRPMGVVAGPAESMRDFAKGCRCATDRPAALGSSGTLLSALGLGPEGMRKSVVAAPSMSKKQFLTELKQTVADAETLENVTNKAHLAAWLVENAGIKEELATEYVAGLSPQETIQMLTTLINMPEQN